MTTDHEDAAPQPRPTAAELLARALGTAGADPVAEAEPAPAAAAVVEADQERP
jgi:hypothetical protein